MILRRAALPSPALARSIIALTLSAVVRLTAAETIAVDFSRATKTDVQPGAAGLNLCWLLDSDLRRPHSPSMADTLARMKVGALRFPYGHLADNYLWHTPPYEDVRGGLRPTVATMQDNPGKWTWAVGPDGGFTSAMDFDEKAVDPGIRVGPGILQAPNYYERLLKDAPQLFDFVSVHQYMHGQVKACPDYAGWRDARSTFTFGVERAVKTLAAAGHAKMEMVVTETGVSGPPELGTVNNTYKALWWFETLMNESQRANAHTISARELRRDIHVPSSPSRPGSSLPAIVPGPSIPANLSPYFMNPI